MSKETTPQPGLIEIDDYAAPEESTDPTPFARPEEVTVRRCQCGRELEACDRCDAKYLEGAKLVLSAAYARMVNAQVAPAEAQAVIDDLIKLAALDGLV